MRMTRNKQMILDLLASDPESSLPAAVVADRLGKRMSDVARTLRLLESQGLVISSERCLSVDRPGFGSYTRRMRCYQCSENFSLPEGT